MKGDKIDSKILDKIAGGVVVDEDVSMSIVDGVITETYSNGRTNSYTVDKLRNNLINIANYDPDKVDKLISMIASDSEYTLADIAKTTGIKPA